MKLLANSCYQYQIMDRSRNIVTKYLNEEKTYAAINSKLFKKQSRELHYMKLNSPKQRLDTKIKSLSGLPSSNTQDSKCWNSTTTFSLKFEE